MSISEQDRRRIASAIQAAEAETSGEIVCVLAQRSTDSATLPILIAATAALLLPWLLVSFTTMPVARILGLQILLFLALSALLCTPRVRIALMPRKVRRAVAHRVAMEQFMIRGIANKRNRCGILIFVSFAERYARIIADQGISDKVPQSEWQSVVDLLIDHLRQDRIADGFIEAVGACGAKLAIHFPRALETTDELPNRIYLI